MPNLEQFFYNHNPENNITAPESDLRLVADVVNKIRSVASDPDEYFVLEAGGRFVCDAWAAKTIPKIGEDVKMEIALQLGPEWAIIPIISSKMLYEEKASADAVTLLKNLVHLRDRIPYITLNQHLGFEIFSQSDMEGIPILDINLEHNSLPLRENEPRKRILISAGMSSGKSTYALKLVEELYHNGCRSNYMRYDAFPLINEPVNSPLNTIFQTITAAKGTRLLPHQDGWVGTERDVLNYAKFMRLMQNINGPAYVPPYKYFGINIFEPTDEENIQLRQIAEEILALKLNDDPSNKVRERLEVIKAELNKSN